MGGGNARISTPSPRLASRAGGRFPSMTLVPAGRTHAAPPPPLMGSGNTTSCHCPLAFREWWRPASDHRRLSAPSFLGFPLSRSLCHRVPQVNAQEDSHLSGPSFTHPHKRGHVDDLPPRPAAAGDCTLGAPARPSPRLLGASRLQPVSFSATGSRPLRPAHGPHATAPRHSPHTEAPTPQPLPSLSHTAHSFPPQAGANCFLS